MTPIKVYGADWCEDTAETIEHLTQLGAPFQYINIAEDAAAEEWITAQNHGKRQTPTIDIGGLVLVEPSNAELDEALKSVLS